MKNIKSKYICLTIDVCEDIYNEDHCWDYIQEIESLRNALVKKFKKTYNFIKDIKFTWFVRADLSIKKQFGSITHLLDKQIWYKFKEKGDEIGWHPHFYKEDSKNLQETDVHKILDEAEKSFNEVKKRIQVSSVRVGRLYSHELLLKKFSQWKIQIDSNCLPSRKREDKNMAFDWSISPFYPYFPSESDYRRPPFTNENHIDILEVPYSTILIKTDYDDKEIRRYINLSYHNKFIKGSLNQMELNNPIVVVFHPFELIKNDNDSKLISFNIDEAIKNLGEIVSYFQCRGFEVEFITLKELKKCP